MDEFDLCIDNWLQFLHYLAYEAHLRVKQFRVMRSFLVIMRKLSRDPLNDSEITLMQKFIYGIVNKHPKTIAPSPVCWNVETMLQYLSNLPSNDAITLQELGGKLALLILLSTMCRSGEVAQLCLSSIQTDDSSSKVTFHLCQLTKNFNFRTAKRPKLQELTIRSLPGSLQICPVKTLKDYIRLSNPFRKGVDKLFVLPGIRYHSGLAHQITIIRWIKNHFKAAGLGEFSVHSTRASASTNALLLGMSVDDIVAKVGWLSNSTFINTYMRPLKKFRKKVGCLLDNIDQQCKSPCKNITPVPTSIQKTKTATSPPMTSSTRKKVTVHVFKNSTETSKKVRPSKQIENREVGKRKGKMKVTVTKGKKTDQFMQLWKSDKRFDKYSSRFKQELDKAKDFVNQNTVCDTTDKDKEQDK